MIYKHCEFISNYLVKVRSIVSNTNYVPSANITCNNYGLAKCIRVHEKSCSKVTTESNTLNGPQPDNC